MATIILICSFIVAIIGIVESHRAKQATKRTMGLTRIGLALVIVSSIGLVFAVTKEIQDSYAAAAQRVQDEQRMLMLQEIHRSLALAGGEIVDPDLKAEIGAINDRISRTYSTFKQADFEASDFSESNFAMARFDHADFTLSWFEGARFVDANLRNTDLRGADLSSAVIDERTKLPTVPSSTER